MWLDNARITGPLLTVRCQALGGRLRFELSFQLNLIIPPNAAPLELSDPVLRTFRRSFRLWGMSGKKTVSLAIWAVDRRPCG